VRGFVFVCVDVVLRSALGCGQELAHINLATHGLKYSLFVGFFQVFFGGSVHDIAMILLGF
jgi:hypothetical protein